MEETASNSAPRRFRLDLAYDGRPYDGWQSQPGGGSVQDAVEQALASVCPAAGRVHGSGRTDAGVSAAGQVAHFDAPPGWRMGGAEWRRALNAKLPPTIRILCCREADPSFHARYSAVEKTYDYHIAVGEILPPLRHGLAWHQRGLGPAGELAEILRAYEGEHDFRAFSAKRHDGRDDERETRRILHEVSLRPGPEAEELVLRFRGTGFLYKMVRFLVGSAVYVLKGRFRIEELRGLLDGAAGAKAPYCAPAAGLVLVEVRYGAPFEPPRRPADPGEKEAP
jgi:tRNA pseudouridine38-40 synthase